MRPQRIAVVGCGSAGPVAAIELANAGHQVTVLESADEPGAVGAGIWLQHLGQQVLDRLGLLDDLRQRSQVVDHVEVVTIGGRRVMNLSYSQVPSLPAAIGVHRGALFLLLWQELLTTTASVRCGVDVTGVRPAASGVMITTTTGQLGPFDLVIGADGSRSVVRDSIGATVRDHAYDYGALWALIDDPDGLAGDTLFQCLDGTQRYFGVLPTGQRQASVFWSLKCDDMDRVRAAGVDAWRERARPFAGERFAPLLERVDELLPARYRDVVVRSPYRTNGATGVVLIGDAAHAMSPQLGAGTSLALADAWSLCHAIATSSDIPTALSRHERARAAHVRWYSWWTRLMMPAFQSDLLPLAVPRDLLSPVLASMPWSRDVMVRQLGGGQISLTKSWPLPEREGR